MEIPPATLRPGETLRLEGRARASQELAPGERRVRLRAKLLDLTAEADLPLRALAPFSLEAPSELALAPGEEARLPVRLVPGEGFSGRARLEVSGAARASLEVDLSGPQDLALPLALPRGLGPGLHQATLAASWEGFRLERPLLLRVTAPPPDFQVSLSPQSLQVERGGSAWAVLTLTPQGGFTGTVGLSLVDPPQGLSLSPQSVQVAGPGPVTQALALTASPSTPTGTYRLKVRGTGQNVTRDVDLTVTVSPPPDFALSLSPASPRAPQGGSLQVQVRLERQGFQGPVVLSLEGSDLLSQSPAPHRIAWSFSPNPATGGEATLTLQVGEGVPPGTYALTARGRAEGLPDRAASLSLTVTPPPDFQVSLSPSSLTVVQGGQAQTVLTLTPQGGFAGAVSLSLVAGQDPVPQGLSLSPQGLQVTGGSPVSQTLTLTASASTPAGTYRLKVRAASGSLVREAALALTVPPPATPNLRVARAEWGQTVLKETLRLVAGKPVLLRVHLVADPTPVSLTQALSGAVYLGSAFQGNLSFACPNPVPTGTDPGNLATTCNATLPGSWVAPGLRVELRADPNDQVAETDEDDNALTLTPSVGQGTALHLTVVPVVYQRQTPTIPDFAQTLWRFWPLKEIPHTTRAPYTFSGFPGSLSYYEGWSLLASELRALRQADGSGRYYYGFVRVDHATSVAGVGYIGHPVAVGVDRPLNASVVMAHELGHNFGRYHAPCGNPGYLDPNYPYPDGKIGTWGYDLADGTLKDPDQYRDLMSYCGPQWVSDYTYEGAQSFLENNPPSPQSLPREEGLLFSGYLLGDRAVLNPPLRSAAPPEGRPSPYRLEVDGREYQVFVLQDSLGALHFQAKVPLGSWGRVALREGGRVLAERARGPTPLAEPQVSLREEAGFLLVRWTGYPFLSLVYVAPDGERTPLGLWHRGGESRFSLEGLPQGGEFEVELSDGLGVRVLRFPR